MAQQKIEIYISKLLEALDNGLTWLQSEDNGNGSIEAQYSITPADIENIRKHPKLKNVEPRTSFVILIDDTIEDDVVTPQEPVKRERKPKVEPELVFNEEDTFNVDDSVASDSFNGFINL